MKSILKKQNKRILSIVLLIMTLLTQINVLSYATAINNAHLYAREKCGLHLQYLNQDTQKWMYVTTTYVTYNHNGVELPAYCLNKNLGGVGEVPDYIVNIDSVINDQRIWRVLTNGYPYKSPEELGVANYLDAFVATKHAIYSVLYDYDVRSYYRGGDEQGNQIVNCIERLVNIGRNGTATYKNPVININAKTELAEDGNYFSKTFSVTSNVPINNYDIQINNFPNGTIVNKNGQNITISIPKTELNNLTRDIQGNIKAVANCEVKSVFYGTPPDPKYQPYAVAYHKDETVEGYATMNVKANNSTLRIMKVDEETKEPLANVTFKVTLHKDNTTKTITTNDSGIATLTNVIPQRATIEEIETQEHYILNDEKIDTTLEWGKTSAVELGNMHKKGNLSILKVDKDNNRIFLGAVEFQLLDEKNNVVNEFKTDVNGKAYLTDVNTGIKKLREVKTGDIYELPTDDFSLEIKWNETTELKIENEKKKGQIMVIKTDEETKEPIKDVEFDVIDEDDNIVDSIKTDENGKAITKELPIDQIYRLKETKTSKIHILNDEEIPVELEHNKVVEVNVENARKKGRIEVYKTTENYNKYTNLEDNSPLKDVPIGLYDMNDNLLETLVTNDEGYAISGLYDVGFYKLKELQAESNRYYILDAEEKIVEITEHGQIVTTNFKNTSKDIEVEIEKTGYIQTQAKDTIKYEFSNISNKSNVYLDDLTWIDYIPTEQIRLKTIYTGTFNQDITYNITYKTNLHEDERILKEDLKSSENYQINLNEIELEEGEYITQTIFHFGKVDVGFKEDVRPLFYCDVLETVQNNDIIINNTEIIGLHDDLVAKDEDNHTTIVYSKEVKASNKKLPKTGF